MARMATRAVTVPTTHTGKRLDITMATIEDTTTPRTPDIITGTRDAPDMDVHTMVGV